MTDRATQMWGDSLPSDVLADPQPVRSERLGDGRLRCGKCGKVVADNSLPGLSASCDFCWVALVVPPADK